ncbi:MAG: hypothetical protein DRI46_10465 [Chloroflexi bacterium]|nr:MAG: hypothetical protein DRI46_10465 [Chloroflexota bacterium]
MIHDPQHAYYRTKVYNLIETGKIDREIKRIKAALLRPCISAGDEKHWVSNKSKAMLQWSILRDCLARSVR